MIRNLAINRGDKVLSVFDMDGTLCDDRHVRHHYKTSDGTKVDPVTHPGVLSAMPKMPYNAVIVQDFMDAIQENGSVIILSARSEPLRSITEAWLRGAGIYDRMYNGLHLAPTYAEGQEHGWKFRYLEQYLQKDPGFYDHLVMYDDMRQILEVVHENMPTVIRRVTTILVEGNSRQLYGDSQLG
jgi:hypothetical protein